VSSSRLAQLRNSLSRGPQPAQVPTAFRRRRPTLRSDRQLRALVNGRAGEPLLAGTNMRSRSRQRGHGQPAFISRCDSPPVAPAKTTRATTTTTDAEAAFGNLDFSSLSSVGLFRGFIHAKQSCHHSERKMRFVCALVVAISARQNCPLLGWIYRLEAGLGQDGEDLGTCGDENRHGCAAMQARGGSSERSGEEYFRAS
jgi:hypothetical protein